MFVCPVGTTFLSGIICLLARKTVKTLHHYMINVAHIGLIGTE